MDVLLHTWNFWSYSRGRKQHFRYVKYFACMFFSLLYVFECQIYFLEEQSDNFVQPCCTKCNACTCTFPQATVAYHNMILFSSKFPLHYGKRISGKNGLSNRIDCFSFCLLCIGTIIHTNKFYTKMLLF